jgi:hypothetical protein
LNSPLYPSIITCQFIKHRIALLQHASYWFCFLNNYVLHIIHNDIIFLLMENRVGHDNFQGQDMIVPLVGMNLLEARQLE